MELLRDLLWMFRGSLRSSDITGASTEDLQKDKDY
jgi:hypothetical protein